MEKTRKKCTVYSMNKDCFDWINRYLCRFPNIIGNTIQKTKNNIMQLPQFKSECMTYLQAQAFAEYYHLI